MPTFDEQLQRAPYHDHDRVRPCRPPCPRAADAGSRSGPRRRSALTGRFLTTPVDVRDHLVLVLGDALRSQEPWPYPVLVADTLIREVHYLIKALSEATPAHPNDGFREQLLTLFPEPEQASQSDLRDPTGRHAR